MKVFNDTTWHEMHRRWTLGELDSTTFGVGRENQEAVRTLLESGNETFESKGILSHHKRINYWNSLPADTEWKTARLELTDLEFERIRTIQDPQGWGFLTNGSYKLVDAALNIESGTRVDARISGAVSALSLGSLNLTGITLHSTLGSEVYTVAEGSARLVALYLCCVKNVPKPQCIDAIDVIWGVSKARWIWSPSHG